MKKELTISRIFQRHVTRLTVFVGILFLVICSVQAILLSLQSHRNACLLFGQRVAEAEGPLARELGLGESTLAREIFSDLESKLTATGASTNLGLLVGAQFADKAETCNASAFSAQVSHPIRFGDVNVATIEGSIWSFPTAPFFFGVLGVLAVLVILLQLWASRLSQDLSRQLIEPILALSKGTGTVHTLEAPQEVVEIAANMAALKFQLIEEGRKALEHTQILERNEMAQQVAHDIQSPLSVLSSLSKRRDSSEDHFRLLESVVDRIQNISASLLSKYKSEEIKAEHNLWINDLVDKIILEKRTLARSKDISIRSVTSPGADFCFASVAAGELSRALSNLIDNGIDALARSKSDGALVVSISMRDEHVSISVTDNGVGIPGDLLAGLGTRGTSYKPGGQGLGLYQARQFAERFGGTLTIQSTIGVGTTVAMTLSKSRTPSWFVPGIAINPKLKYVIIDDDPAIHAIWRTRIPEAIHLVKVDDSELQNLKLNLNLFFLFDYQLGADAPTGLEIIEKLGLEQRSIIVTSRYDDQEIQAKARSLKVRIMPKMLIDFIPGQILGGNNCDLVLIDDDQIMHDCWKVATKSAGLRMSSFYTVDEFLLAEIPVQIPIYLDQHLGNGCVGTELGSKIAGAGYCEIHIVTGYNPTTIAKPKYISSVRQKNFPLGDFLSIRQPAVLRQ